MATSSPIPDGLMDREQFICRRSFDYSKIGWVRRWNRVNHPIKGRKHPMKNLQDVLGQAHDLELLRGFTGKNAKIKAEQTELNTKALRLSKPALNFAVSQLKENREAGCKLSNRVRKMHLLGDRSERFKRK